MSAKLNRQARLTVVLELTQREAEMLKCLTLRAIEWDTSGTFGEDARDVFFALDAISVDEADYVTADFDSWPTDRTWVPAVEEVIP